MGMEYRFIKRERADGGCWHEVRVVETDLNGRTQQLVESEPSCPGGETLSDLIADLTLMLSAAKEQVLELRGSLAMA